MSLCHSVRKILSMAILLKIPHTIKKSTLKVPYSAQNLSLIIKHLNLKIDFVKPSRALFEVNLK